MIVGGIAINLMDQKKIKEKRERENERFWYLSTECVLLATAHIVLESCLISFTTPKKTPKEQQQQIFFHPNGRRERERERTHSSS